MTYLKTLEERRDQLKARKSELEKELKPISAELEALEELLRVTGAPSETSDYPFKRPLKERILYTLSKIEEGTAAEIDAFMRQHEPNVSSNSVVITTSSMAKMGELRTLKKIGRANVYMK